MSSDPKLSRSLIEHFALFVIGFGLFMLTRRSEVVPTVQAMIVIAPVFILRFSRILPMWRAIALTLLGFILSMNIALWGLFEISDPLAGLAFNAVRSTMLALLYALPFIIDRILYQRFGSSFWSVLVFPVAMTSMLFLSSLEGPFDGTSAKTIFAYGSLEFMQLYALTGLWGFIFLWSLPAALVNYAWAHGFNLRASVVAVGVMGLVGGGVYGYGTARISSADVSDTVRVAAAVLLPEDDKPVSMEPFFASKRVLPYEQTLGRIKRLTEEAVAEGAELVAFQEFALTVMEPDVDRLLANYQQIAKQNAVWLSITYAWYANSDDEKGNNVHLLIDDQGEIRIDYNKRYLWGFGGSGETSVFNKGPTVIQSVETPFGRMAASICRDMAFPAYALQAGRAGADIMLTPSYDFPKSNAPSDTGRAIENGFSNIRPTYNGISYAIDPYGRILAQMDSADGGSGLMLADIPVKGTETLYTRLGDWFGWLSVAVIVLLACIAIFRGWAKREQEPA